MKLRLVSAIIIAGLLAGCTSSGTVFNPPNGGNVVYLQITGSNYVIAYQTNPHAKWQLTSAGQTQFETTGGTAYGVAYTCPTLLPASSGTGVRPQGPATWRPIAVIESTTQEFNTVPIQCGSSSNYATLSGSYDSTAFPSTSYVEVDYDDVGAGGTGTYSETGVRVATQDVFGLAFDSGGNLLAVKTYPNVDVTSGGATQNVTFAAGDTLGATKTVSWTNQPAGMTNQYSYLDFGDDYHEPEIGSSTTSTVSYPTIAAADVSGSDFYSADSYAYISGSGTASDVEAEQFAPSLPSSIELPNAWNESEPAVTGQPAYAFDFSGLNAPNASGTIGGYILSQEWGTITLQQGWILALVTNGYLRAVGSTNYSAPNIALAGFSTMTVAPGDIIPWRTVAVKISSFFLGTALFIIVLDAGHGSGAQSVWNSGVVSQSTQRPMGLRPASTGTSGSTTSGIGYLSGAIGCTTEGTGASCPIP